MTKWPRSAVLIQSAALQYKLNVVARRDGNAMAILARLLKVSRSFLDAIARGAKPIPPRIAKALVKENLTTVRAVIMSYAEDCLEQYERNVL